MKKLILIVFLLLMSTMLLCSQTIAYAHPGKTDSNRGHYDRSTGEYHYHHGYPPHLHPNGVCPYEFDDRTGMNSGDSTQSKSISTETASYGTQRKDFKSIILDWVGIVFVIGALIKIFVVPIIDAIRKW